MRATAVVPLLAACLLSAAPARADSEADLLTLDRIAYELAAIEVAEYELRTSPELEPPTWPTPEPDPGKVPRFNPCAHLPPDEPTILCPCPPMPPWGWCP